jgi:deaminated glutathione amidase
LKVSLIQLNANQNKIRNIDKACSLVKKAANNGSEVILLPEVFNYRGPINNKELYNKIAEDIPGESINPLIDIAKENKVNIIAGSIYERSNKSQKVYNTSIVISKSGLLIGKYRKMNLFKANINGKVIDESKIFNSGDKATICKINNIKFGLSICYDLRFPELYFKNYNQKVNVIVVLSSFTKKTGELHWEVLLRARAIENYSYVLAPNQYGKDGNNVETYGKTMIINPNGEIVDSLGIGMEGILTSDLKIENNLNYPQIN